MRRTMNWSCGLAALLGVSVAAGPAFAQAAPEMCGDGTTFTVPLPGTLPDTDDTGGLFEFINPPLVAPDDSITLPNGCRLYVLLVSGYHQNEHFDKITFYEVAEFAARQNGYVHVAWWNNLLSPYMGRPLHAFNVNVFRFLPPELIEVPTNPGGYHSQQLSGLLFPGDAFAMPKANPSSDRQFQADAARMIRAIKQHNPDALIVVAGHSMGGDSVARLGREAADLPIDLLAVIDPGNNRDSPRGVLGQRHWNWTRWRATHLFRGYQRWDCVRNAAGVCHDHDPRFFFFDFRCVPSGEFFPHQPLIASNAPLVCPAATGVPDAGVRLGFGENIRHLYHRWQHEFLFPFDYLQDERFNFPAPLSPSLLDRNFQWPIQPNAPFENSPAKTCWDVGMEDPRRPGFRCGAFDGHGEVVGFRAPQNDLANPNAELEFPGLLMRNWPGSPDGRRLAFVEMGTADATWPHRPADPDTCMVCDDINSIIQHLLDQQPAPGPAPDTTAPFTVASANPGPNANGWNATDVVVTLTARDDDAGTGVSDISYALSGAETSMGVIQGANGSIVISAEGLTRLTYFARDNAGNLEAARPFEVRIDKTAPAVAIATDVPQNALGWFNSDVVVSFTASDGAVGSGVALAPAAIAVSAEGSGQEVSGVAEDLAGNRTAARLIVNLDKTAPGVAISQPADGAVFVLNAPVLSDFGCSDALSGVGSCDGPTLSGQPIDTSSVGSRAFTVSGVDLAGNLTTATHHYTVQYSFGFHSPVSPLPFSNVLTGGRTVPLKFWLADANGTKVSDLAAVQSLTSGTVPCDAGARPVEIDATDAAGHTGLRYDSETGAFVYNWKTDRSWGGSCRMLEVSLADGTTRRALFEFR